MNKIENPQAIFYDLDNTAISHGHLSNLEDHTIKAMVQLSHNIPVIFCTTRTFVLVEHIVKKLDDHGFNNDGKIYGITNGGTYGFEFDINTKEYNTLFSDEINKNELIDILKQISEIETNFLISNDLVRYYFSKSVSEIYIDHITSEITTMLYAAGMTKEERTTILDQITLPNSLYTMETHSFLPDKCDFQIAIKGKNKGSGIEEFCDLLGIDPKQSIGVGDGKNDTTMKNVVGELAAMGNSEHHLLDIADYVLPPFSNDENSGFMVLLNDVLTRLK